MCQRSPLNCLLGSRETQKGERTGAEMPAACRCARCSHAVGTGSKKTQNKKKDTWRINSYPSSLRFSGKHLFLVPLSWIRKAVFSFLLLLCALMVLRVKVDLPPMALVEMLTFEMEPFQELITVKRRARVIRDGTKGRNNFRIMNAGMLQVYSSWEKNRLDVLARFRLVLTEVKN